jgi:hypothetical protein
MMMSPLLLYPHASSLKQQSVGTCCYTRKHYPDFESTSLCSYSLKLPRSSKYQIVWPSVWPNRDLNTQSTTLKASMLTITLTIQLPTNTNKQIYDYKVQRNKHFLSLIILSFIIHSWSFNFISFYGRLERGQILV